MTLLSRARQCARMFGLEVQRANAMTVWRKRLPQLLALNEIDLVVDVGANDGGFAAELFGNGFQGEVFSFEALPSAHKALSRKAKVVAPGRWHVAPQGALGKEDGAVDFYESANSVSSSFLKMSEQHIWAAPESAPTGQITVPIRTLDGCLDSLHIAQPFYLKIDVQGAEGDVLQGARQVLQAQVRGLQVEMSIGQLYEGQATADELDRKIREYGFHLWDIIPGFRDPASLKLLQYDGVYMKIN